mmetsp:Transcript_32491/g.87248  ORF Transcript_32491/g.87248 Transcript_32491/m.87248 type:complete len:127 (-) Transcript_32491:698-1078(-)
MWRERFLLRNFTTECAVSKSLCSLPKEVLAKVSLRVATVHRGSTQESPQSLSGTNHKKLLKIRPSWPRVPAILALKSDWDWKNADKAVRTKMRGASCSGELAKSKRNRSRIPTPLPREACGQKRLR